MDYLLYYIKTFREIIIIPYLATIMETAWVKLADYYKAIEDSLVYSAVIVLHPSLK
jgi:hypothetical protein